MQERGQEVSLLVPVWTMQSSIWNSDSTTSNYSQKK